MAHTDIQMVERRKAIFIVANRSGVRVAWFTLGLQTRSFTSLEL